MGWLMFSGDSRVGESVTLSLLISRVFWATRQHRVLKVVHTRRKVKEHRHDSLLQDDV